MRTDAPHELRGIVPQLAYECGFSPKTLRTAVCRPLRKRVDESNWSEYPNIDDEVRSLIDHCKWFREYDIIEAIAAANRDLSNFNAELNAYFVEKRIGWKLVDGKVEIRGAEVFEQSVIQAESVLNGGGHSTARNELHKALSDLSRRPAPDITDAIQHSMAALECVVRDAFGDNKATLGEVLKRYPPLVPKPLDQAVSKIWGFASENGRHIVDGQEPSFEEAELVSSRWLLVPSRTLLRKH